MQALRSHFCNRTIVSVSVPFDTAAYKQTLATFLTWHSDFPDYASSRNTQFRCNHSSVFSITKFNDCFWDFGIEIWNLENVFYHMKQDLIDFLPFLSPHSCGCDRNSAFSSKLFYLSDFPDCVLTRNIADYLNKSNEHRHQRFNFSVPKTEKTTAFSMNYRGAMNH